MQRITITIEDDLLSELDAFMERSGAFNRSEAIRDLVRRGLAETGTTDDALCYGIISYALNHGVRNLASRVPQTRLDRHDQTVAALSVPVDHSSSVDVVVMHGPLNDVKSYAQALFLERGVMHGQVSLIPLVEETTFHSHGPGKAHMHVHRKIQETF